MSPRIVFIALTALSLAGNTAEAATIRVPSDQPTIQGGIDAAAAGDTVLVLEGWYQELGIMMKSGVCLRSESDYGVTIGSFAPSSIDKDAIVCDGVDATATIQGFLFDGNYLLPGTFHSGIRCISSNVTVRNCSFRYWKGPALHLTNSSPLVEVLHFEYCGSSTVNGGGIYAIDSSPTIRNCSFTLNEAANGGGVWCGGTTSASIEACTFNSCAAVTNGGNIYCEGETAVLGCLIFDATADRRYARNGVGIACAGEVNIEGCTLNTLGRVERVERGGGIYIISGSATIIGCQIYWCNAASGGAIHAASGTHSISDCQLYENGAWEGGGVAVVGGDTNLERMVIAANFGYLAGGGVHVANASASIVGCTITNNTGQSAPASGIVAKNATVDIRQSILRFSCIWTRDVASTAGSTVTVECCNIDPELVVEDSGSIVWGPGNFTEAPSFCHPMMCQGLWALRDFRLTDDSPCLPENNSCGLLIGALSSGCPTTAIESRSWGSIKALYRSSE